GRLSWPSNSTTTLEGGRMQKPPNNPMQPAPLAKARRCLARTRGGSPCQSPVVKGRSRCRMHGGTNPGAPVGNRNAWKHGARARDVIEMAKLLGPVVAEP